MGADLKAVVRKIYDIAKERYNNDVQTYIQSIYYRLSDEEQHVLLKGLVPYLFDVESPPSAIVTRHQQLKNEFDIETFHELELIRLKSWFLKLGGTTLATLMVLFFIYLVVNSFVPSQSESLGREIFDFVRTLLGSE